ncbi:alpha-galactosidase [Pseudoflavonifractor sp. 524-17]|uniref:alpha-galactosidase n=1 Tax=Pseudoflavonifractor sp. 524-17 TaxID=2304577 RepID=UPI00137AFC8F|nr:alpha-galactosidase [Pseudoflavonifractor sp. 524-17]NCE65763.1 alpha-galactosidase [Pseudoflavonifractor sp. 524-17]
MIICDETNLLFTLHTKNTTYQMKADSYRVLLHTYYGPRISGGDLSYLIQYTDRGFSPNPGEAGHCRTYSLDTLPQEYSSCGVGDFRLPSLETELADGSHITDLRFIGFARQDGKYALDGLPAFFGGGEWETLILFLEDTAAHLRVELYYGVLEAQDLITRAVRIVNQGNRPIRLYQAASVCLDFQRGDLDLITFDGRHVMERCPHRAPLRPGVQGVGSIRGTSSHQHNPFVVLCEPGTGEDSGLCWGAMLLYSGNFQAQAERSQFEGCRLVMGINPHHFCYTLAPNEGFTAPEAALICSPNGFSQMSRQYHRAIRKHLLRDPLAGQRKPVLINNWEATYFDFDADRLVQIAQAAAPLGIGLFVMDDGWFGSRDSDHSGLGDWSVNQKKLPGGLEALVPRIKALGMSFGLWIEPEMVNEDSQLYREHPDWVLGIPGRAQTRGRSQLVLDFSRAEVRDHIYSALRAVLSSADITYIKWDMNRSLSDVWSAALPTERQGEVYHRYVLGVYDLLNRFHRDFPNLLMEGCSGGGGRFDAGMLYYTPQIWCSDNTDAIDRLHIQYGTSFCYPPCTMGAHVSSVPNEQNGRVTPLETRGVVAMSGAFGYEMDLGKTTQAEREIIQKQVADYHAYYQLIQDGDYYRLSNPFQDPFTAWAHVSQDQRQALVSVVTGSVCAAPSFVTLRLKGLDPSLRYQVNGVSYPGDVLMQAGYPLPMPWGDYQSVQLYLSAQ